MTNVLAKTYANSIAEKISVISNYSELNREKMEMYDKKLAELVKFRESLLDLDIDFNQYLCETKKDLEVYPANTFHSKLGTIRDDSLIIYVKKAQLYKVYKSDNIDEFQNDDNTHYRKSMYGPVYEVVRDTHPQKLVINIVDDVSDRIQHIKTCIIEFLRTIPEFANTQTDLKIFGTENNTEFIINSILLKNLTEKENFIDDFIRFMQIKGNIELASKIQVRPPPSELKGARFYAIPSSKQLFEGSSNLSEQLISTPNNQSQPVIIQNNTIIIQNNTTHNNNNITNTTNTLNVANVTKKTLKTFYKFIYETKPDWFKENELVDIEIIENAYRNYFNDTTTTKALISRQLNNNIFTQGVRVNRIFKKKLVNYSDLKKIL